MKIRPIRDHILIKPDEVETKTASGFHLTDLTADKLKGKLRFGEVLAVGPGLDNQPMTIKVGERVVLSQYGPTEFEHEGEKYIICPQYDVEAVING